MEKYGHKTYSLYYRRQLKHLSSGEVLLALVLNGGELGGQGGREGAGRIDQALGGLHLATPTPSFSS